MNNLTLFVLGLVLISIPISVNGKQCFSQNLNPSYPCCSGDKVVYTDSNGDWGVENGDWCGIGGSDPVSCFAEAYGYPCCKGDKVFLTDESGSWGIENGQWCGIGGDSESDSCFAEAYGYPCCETCVVKYSDESGNWGKENKQWCGIKDSCTIKDPVQNGTDIDFSFLKLENNKENMLYSPLSIKYGLRMLQEGASGNTYNEINKLIGNNELTKYESIDKVLSIANGLFIRDTYYEHVKAQYIDTLENKYNAEVIQDKFENAQNANQWIEDKTMGIIKNMLKDESVANPYNVMILINALAIDMEWANGGFSYQSTYGRTFYLDDGQKITATTMFKKEGSKNASYYIDDDVTVLTMDLNKYDGIQFEFMAIMPEKNLTNFVENVTKEQINHIDENLKLASDETYGLRIYIPKFKFNYELDFKQDLIKLGIKDTFNEEDADLSKISDGKERNENLYVSEALHKADIEFTEDGIKAAAVTVFMMGAGSAMPVVTYPVDVIINKPFMFIIRDKNTKDIWFTGTVYEPNLWKDEEEDYTPVNW